YRHCRYLRDEFRAHARAQVGLRLFPCDRRYSRHLRHALCAIPPPRLALAGRAGRQAHRKDRAFARLARHRHIAAHHARELAGDGKAEPGAPVAARGQGSPIVDRCRCAGFDRRRSARALPYRFPWSVTGSEPNRSAAKTAPPPPRRQGYTLQLLHQLLHRPLPSSADDIRTNQQPGTNRTRISARRHSPLIRRTIFHSSALIPKPYKGAADAVTGVLGGQVQMFFGDIGGVLALVREGALRALAVSSETRNAFLPDVPTMMESGVPDYVVLTYI